MRTLITLSAALLLSVTPAAIGCYHLPTWNGEVTVSPLERESVKKCGTGMLTAEGKKQLTREPYLQMTTMTGTTIAWGSKEARGEVVLHNPDDGSEVVAVPGQYAGDPALKDERLAAQKRSGKLKADDIYLLAASFAKLEPNHLYCYQLVNNGIALTELAPLTTAPGPDLEKPFRFVAVGDVGTGGDAAKAIAQRMTEVPFDLVLLLGDIAYESGTASQLQNKFFSIYANILRYVPSYPTIGNHERRTRQGAPYFDAFVLPAPERYYSFDWGDVHFVAIDTTHRDTEQVQWLQQDLAKTKQRWKVVYGHHPMYTNSLRGPQQWMRKAYAKIFTDNKVDLVITGHEHHYERFRVGNVNYIVSGGGGGQLTRFVGAQQSLKKATRHHFLLFEASSDKLSMKAIDINGKDIETMEVTKESDKAKPEVKVDEKLETKQTPIAPEKTTEPDEKLHDEPDDDKNDKHLPPQKIPNAPDKPTPDVVKEAQKTSLR